MKNIFIYFACFSSLFFHSILQKNLVSEHLRSPTQQDFQLVCMLTSWKNSAVSDVLNWHCPPWEHMNIAQDLWVTPATDTY